RTMVGANVIAQEARGYNGRTLPYIARGQNGTASITSENNEDWQFENTLNYSNDFNDIHSIKALLGQSIQVSNSFVSTASTQGFLDDYFEYNNLGIANN